MLPLVVPSAVIRFEFDPVTSIGGFAVRWETLGVALAIFVGLVVAALVARGTPVDPTRPPDAPGEEPGELNRLRADDLLYIAVAAVPGAVIGGRIGYALLHLDSFGGNPGALVDVGRGGFELALAVVGGTLTAAVVAAMLGAPLGRWLHALTLPVLLVLAGGKAAMVLGGSGQGQLATVSWATAYLGAGPWGSLAPELPAHPAQAFESLATIVVLLLTMVVVVLGAFHGRTGGAFFLGLGLWAIARTLVAFTWRDPVVLGPFNAGQAIAISVAAGSLVLMTLVGGASVARARHGGAGGAPGPESDRSAGAVSPGGDAVSWPDPGERPRL